MGAPCRVPPYRSRIASRDDRARIFHIDWRHASAHLSILYRLEPDRILIGRVSAYRSSTGVPYLDAWTALCEYCPEEESVAGGWARGDVGSFLGLDESDVALIDIRLGLARLLNDSRYRHRWTQAELARIVGTDRSQISRLEEPDSSVSLDLLVAAVLRSGVSRAELAATVRGRERGAKGSSDTRPSLA